MGNVAFGKYKLIAELGHGGMADVFLAVQAGPAGLGFRKLTVVKRLRQNLADEPEFIAMLVDEARIAARLNHPNVVQTNEVGSVGNQYFLAMEYLDGQPFHRIQHRSAVRAKAGQPIPLTPAVQYLILMDALAGLHHAHELQDYDGSPLGIVHRDMTPQNVFLTYEGQVKVVDFGIAKAAGRSSETRQGVVKGKVRYMAPEQALGLPVTRRTDIFAVGIMMWEAAIGKRMWRDHEEIEIVRALVSGDLPPMPRTIDASVPEEIDRIVRKAVCLRAEDRYATAEDFRTDIEHYLASTGELVTLRRQMPAMLSDLFKDKRAEIRSIIEQQLATIEDGPTSGVAVLPQDSGSTSLLSLRPTPLAPAVALSSFPSAEGLAPASSATEKGITVNADLAAPSPRPKRRGALVGAGVVAVAIAAVGFWQASRSSSSSSSSASTRPATVASTIWLQLSATPPTARASVDDQPFVFLPAQLSFARDSQPHRVRLEADGYEPRTESLSFTQDLRTSFTLIKVPAEPTLANASAGTKPAITGPTANRQVPPWRPVVKQPDPTPPPPPPPVTTAPPVPPPAPRSSSDKHHLTLDPSNPWPDR